MEDDKCYPAKVRDADDYNDDEDYDDYDVDDDYDGDDDADTPKHQ